MVKIRPNKYCLREVNLVFHMYIFSLMCQSVNLFRKIAVSNIGCVFVYFCGGNKSDLRS